MTSAIQKPHKSRLFSMLLLCFLCGGAMGACLLWSVAGPAVFVLAAPALALMKGRTGQRGGLLLPAAFALGLCMVGYSPAFCIQTDLPAQWVLWVDGAVYAVLCLVHGAVLTGALWLGHRLPCPRWLRWACVALFWTAAEWLLGVGPLAWSTLRLSLTLWRYPLLLRTASLGGQLLVSFLVMAVNALLAAALCRRRIKRALPPVAAALALLIANVALGALAPDAPAADMAVTVVQPGVRVVAEKRGDVYERTLAMAKEAAASPADLVLLPESILPSNFMDSPSFSKAWGKLAKGNGADLLVGGSQDGHSAVYHFGPDGTLKTVYQKIREVPIFENGEGERTFRWVAEDRSGLLSTASGPVGVMICYESLFSSLAGKAAAEGAGLLVVLTNDSWFDSTAAKDLHLANGVYRAVETGRTLVQAGLNGHTAVVDASGRVTDRVAHTGQAILQTQVSRQSVDTLYSRIGDWWLLAGMVVLVAAACVIAVKNKKPV